MALWIQGFFFQDALKFEVVTVNKKQVALFQKSAQFMYRGSIWQNPDANGSLLMGVMEDSFGISLLSNIEHDEAHFAFTKRYEDREDDIRYLFEAREGLTWIGRWSGRVVGEGVSRCLVTELPDEFYSVESVVVALSGVN